MAQLNEGQIIENFWLAGINYKKAAAGLRGEYSINAHQYEKLLDNAKTYGVSELFVLSTCNRTEIYGLTNSKNELTKLLCTVADRDENGFIENAYFKSGRSAIDHLFQVATGLDSLILGDLEILGQLKVAVKFSRSRGYIGFFLERLVNSVLQAAKAVRTHTALSTGTTSVSFAAVRYIREYVEMNESLIVSKDSFLQNNPDANSAYCNLLKKIKDMHIVVLGAGKIGASACRNIVDYLNTTNVTLINRTEDTARRIADELCVKYTSFDNAENAISAANIILVSTASKEPIIYARHLEGQGSKLVIDFSIPCNVANDVQALPNVTYVNIDTLSNVKDETLQARMNDIPKAQSIINNVISEFMEWYEMRKYVPLLIDVKLRLHEIKESSCIRDSNECDLSEVRIQQIINNLALSFRREPANGCHCIKAIADYVY